jgi:hypothetical protein
MTQTRYLMIIVSGGASDRFLGGPGKVQKILFETGSHAEPAHGK